MQHSSGKAKAAMWKKLTWMQWSMHTTVSDVVIFVLTSRWQLQRLSCAESQWQKCSLANILPCTDCLVFAAMNELTWRSVLQWESLHHETCSDPKLLRFMGKPHDLRQAAKLLFARNSSA